MGCEVTLVWLEGRPWPQLRSSHSQSVDQCLFSKQAGDHHSQNSLLKKQNKQEFFLTISACQQTSKQETTTLNILLRNSKQTKTKSKKLSKPVGTHIFKFWSTLLDFYLIPQNLVTSSSNTKSTASEIVKRWQLEHCFADATHLPS